MSSRSSRLVIAYAVVVVCLLAGASSALAAGTTFTVSGFSDGPVATCNSANVCENLRSAVAAAVSLDAPATISLGAGTYTLTEGELNIDSAYSGGTAVTITGAGPTQTVIDQTTANSRVLDYTSGGPYQVSGLEITGGHATGTSPEGPYGGGIDGNDSDVNLDDTLITGNSAVAAAGANGTSSSYGEPAIDPGEGGGFYDYDGGIQIIDSSIVGNSAAGGAGGAAVAGSHDEAGYGSSGYGGGLLVDGAVVLGSTIAGNTATGGAGGAAAGASGTAGEGGYGYGGGIASSDLESAWLVNSTVVNNTAIPGAGGVDTGGTNGSPGGGSGGGVYADVYGTLDAFSDTVASNTAQGPGSFGGNAWLVSETASQWTFEDTVIADGTSAEGSNCEIVVEDGPPMIDDGHNLESDAGGQCEFTTTAQDMLGVNPELGALANNGGPTETELPLAGSPLIAAGGTCTSTLTNTAPTTLDVDQRDDPRVGACDIGAVQLQAAARVALPTMSGTVSAGSTLSCSAAGAFSGDGLSYTYQWLLNGSVIAGQSGTTYTVEPGNNGNTISCAVTATAVVGPAITSDSVAVLARGPGVSVWDRSSSLTAKGRKLRLTIICKGGTTPCTGRFLLSAKVHGKKASTIGSASYKVEPAASHGFTVKLSKRAITWLRKHHHKLTAELKLTPANGGKLSYKVKIRGT